MRLLRQIDQLRATLASTPGEIEDAERIGEQASAGDTERRVLELCFETLRDVDRALERDQRRVYGICESCGQAIGALRMKALPFAVECLRCRAEHEEGEERCMDW